MAILSGHFRRCQVLDLVGDAVLYIAKSIFAKMGPGLLRIMSGHTGLIWAISALNLLLQLQAQNPWS
eukprot:COSAG01_NODE_25751_length_734_cov_1.823622_2_plen_66_part_01